MNKLFKYKNIFNFKNFLEIKREEILNKDLYLKSFWQEKIFQNQNEIVLELAAGSADYSIALAKKYKNKNFIAIDIKGDRLWKGLEVSEKENISNLFFLRTNIEFLNRIFSKNEIAEIWITFPDPQIKQKREKHRLVNLKFLKIYVEILKPNGFLNLKTDSKFLFGYLLGILQVLNIKPEYANNNIYEKENQSKINLEDVQNIKTIYEKKFLKQNKNITYIKTLLDKNKF